MILFINWVVSVLAIFVLAYFYRFYSSFSELIKTIDIGGVIFALFLGAVTASIGIIVTFVFQKLILNGAKFANWSFLAISLLVSIFLCTIIIYKLSVILTET